MNLLSLGYIFIFLVFEVTADCPALYRRYSKDHTYCRTNPSCQMVKSSVSNADITAILDEHNTLRSKIATGKQANLPSASDMLEMVWDNELAAVAQKHANLCKFDHDCNNCRRVQNFGVGQNLAEETLPGGTNPTPNWRAMIKMWYNEVQFFQRSFNNPFVPPPSVNTYGHFSQVVWASSWRIGCGFSAYKDGGSVKTLYTCNYGPGGNMDGGIMYKEGAACSACPMNSCCGSSCGGKAGLCKITDNRGPTYPQPKGNFFYCDFQKQSDCNFNIKGTNKWLIYNTLSGNYLGIVLKGGEESKIIFNTHMKPKTSSFCFIMNYRRGPNVDGQQDSGIVTQTFTIVQSNYKVPNKLNPMPPPFRQDFTKFSMSLGWNMETEVMVELAVPSGQPEQFLEISSVYAKEGKC